MPCLTEHPDHQEYQKRHDTELTAAANTVPATANSTVYSTVNSTGHHETGNDETDKTAGIPSVSISASVSVSASMASASAAASAAVVAPFGVMGIKPDLSKFSSVMGGGAKAMPRHGTVYLIGLWTYTLFNVSVDV